MFNAISSVTPKKPTIQHPPKERLAISFAARQQLDSFNGKTMNASKPGVAEASKISFGKVLRIKKTVAGDPVEPGLPGPYGEVTPQYRNMLPQKDRPISKPNPNLKEEITHLKHVGNVDLAEQRIKAFSNYMLKMVGFVTPSGYHWFPQALGNLINASQGTKVRPEKMAKPARELWQCLAIADDYWTSDQFIRYIKAIEPSPARDATLKALQELRAERAPKYKMAAFMGRNKSHSKPIETGLKFIDELMVCAYSGVKLDRDSADPVYKVSAEHIFPQSLGGKDNDFNFLMASADSNNLRKNMKLIAYLKGHSRL